MEGYQRFSVFFCKIKQGYFWPVWEQIRFIFFFSLSEPCIWQTSCRGVKIRAPIFNALAVFARCQFCLSSSGWLSAVSQGCWLLSEVALKPRKVKPSPRVRGWVAWIREKEKEEGRELIPPVCIPCSPAPSLILTLQFIWVPWSEILGFYGSLLPWNSHCQDQRYLFSAWLMDLKVCQCALKQWTWGL